eukprot:3675040-Prymnesium_polylepis.1
MVVSVVVVVAGGLAWSRRQAFKTDNTPRLKNLMAARRRFEPLLKIISNPWGRVGVPHGAPWEGDFPVGWVVH